MAEVTSIDKKQASQSQRFMDMVVREFTSGVGELALTSFQRRLAQNYFVSLDASLKAAEEKRLKKTGKYQDKVPVAWANVNMEKLARDVVACARVGFDPAQKNHINLVPFLNKTTGKYDITVIEGYRGIELKATKYGLSVPDNVVVELVYSTDKFRSIKKDATHKYEEYEFEVTNDFDRGDIVGGFYCHFYSEHPEKNRLVVMSLKEILKRKPEYASPEFWGGEKDVWKDGEKVGKKAVDGWYEKMCWKTVYRAAYGDITIDSQKIDDDYLRLKVLEREADELGVEEEIAENANKTVIDITPDEPDESGSATSEGGEPAQVAAPF